MTDALFLAFIIALVFSIIHTPLIRNLAIRKEWVDDSSDHRKIHTKPIPRIGGVSIFSGFAVAIVSIVALGNLNILEIGLPYDSLLKIILISVSVFLLGLVDDRIKLNATIKLIAQVVAASTAYMVGFKIQMISVPFLPDALNLGIFGLPFTILWFVGVTNAFNLIDGTDGLAAGLGLIATAVLFVSSILSGHFLEALLSITLAGSLIGFLRYNFHPASIFMGDSGSLFLGFFLATISITGSQKSSTAIVLFIPFLVLAVPILDTCIAYIRRVMAGKAVFEPDREHVHHKLLDKGLKQNQIAFILYGVAAFLGFYSLIFVNSSNRYLGYTFIIIFVAMVIAIQRIGYDEFSELFRYVTSGLRRQGKQLASQIQIKKLFANGNGEIATVEKLFANLRSILADMGFDYVSLRFWSESFNGSHRDFVWQRSELPFREGAWRITLPIQFGDSKMASLTLSKLDGHEMVPMRLSVIVQDLPIYLKEALDKISADHETKEAEWLRLEKQLFGDLIKAGVKVKIRGLGV